MTFVFRSRDPFHPHFMYDWLRLVTQCCELLNWKCNYFHLLPFNWHLTAVTVQTGNHFHFNNIFKVFFYGWIANDISTCFHLTLKLMISNFQLLHVKRFFSFLSSDIWVAFINTLSVQLLLFLTLQLFHLPTNPTLWNDTSAAFSVLIFNCEVS